MFAGGTNMDEHLERLAQGTFSGFGTHLVVGPMYHTGPLSGMRLLCAGVPSVILAKFDAEAALAAIDRYSDRDQRDGADALRAAARPARRREGEVRRQLDEDASRTPAQSAPIDVKAAMIEWFGPVFRDAYGATEVGTVVLDHERGVAGAQGIGRSIGAASSPRSSSTRR